MKYKFKLLVCSYKYKQILSKQFYIPRKKKNLLWNQTTGKKQLEKNLK